jgi:hypothetical protein
MEQGGKMKKRPSGPVVVGLGVLLIMILPFVLLIFVIAALLGFEKNIKSLFNINETVED